MRRIYRVSAPEPGTVYQPDVGWLVEGVAYIVDTGRQRLDDHVYTEVGANHDEITDDVPAWYEAASERLTQMREQGQPVEDPRADEAGPVLRVVSPNVVTYCDSAEPAAPDAAWFVEGVAYLRADHPRAAYYARHAEYAMERVDREPAWWAGAYAALRSMPAQRIGPPMADAAGPAYSRRG